MTDLKEKREYVYPMAFSRERLLSALAAHNYDVTLIQAQLDDLIRFSSLYGASESAVADLILEDTDTAHFFHVKDFLRDLRNLIQYQRKDSVSSSQRVFFGEGDIARFLNSFNDLSPKELLATLINAEPASYMLTELERLKKTLNVPSPVMNVVLDYSLRKCHGEFSSLFIEKVSYSLNSNSINDSYDAMVFLNMRDFAKSQSQRKGKRPTDEKAVAKSRPKLPQEEQDARLKDIDI